MNATWAPVWNTIVDSSIWEEDDSVCKVFVTLLALKGDDHMVRLNAYQIGKKANKSEAEVLRCLEILSKPDTKRLEPQPFDGRRIQKVEDGWLILNGQKYQDKIQAEIRRRQQAKWMREQRMIESSVRTGEGINPEIMTPGLKKRYDKALQKAMKSKPLPGELAYVKAIEDGDTELAAHLEKKQSYRNESTS